MTMGNKNRQTMRDNGRQGETRPIGKADTPSKTIGDKGRQDPLKADPPSNTGTHVGRQWETREKRGDKTSGRRTHHQHRHTCGETMGDKGNKISGRRTHHPTPDIVSKQREPNQYTVWGRIYKYILFKLKLFFSLEMMDLFFLLIFPDKFPVVPRTRSGQKFQK